MTDLRKAQVFHLDTWMDVEFSEIKEGDKFRLFESTGEQVYDELHVGEFIAQSDAHIRLGVWCIISDGEFI